MFEADKFVSKKFGWSIEEAQHAIDEFLETSSVLTKKQKLKFIEYQDLPFLGTRMAVLRNLLCDFFKQSFTEKCKNLIYDDCIYLTIIFNIHQQYKDPIFNKYMKERFIEKYHKQYQYPSAKSFVRKALIRDIIVENPGTGNSEIRVLEPTIESWLYSLFSTELNPKYFHPVDCSWTMVDQLIFERELTYNHKRSDTYIEFIDALGPQAFHIKGLRNYYSFDRNFKEIVDKKLFNYKKDESEKNRWINYLGIKYILDNKHRKDARSAAKDVAAILDGSTKTTESRRVRYSNIKKMLVPGTTKEDATIQYYGCLPEYKELILEIELFFGDKKNE